MADKYIFTMLGLNKYYGNRHVLKDINLCFFPGAKIGIVGNNGAGKSTILRIMAGVDKDYRGQADLTKGYKVGFVPQEPQLESGKTVRQNVEAAFSEVLSMVHEYEKISAEMCDMEPDAMDKAMEKMAELQDKIEAADGWELDTKINVAANALVLPPDDMIVDNLSGGEKQRIAIARAVINRPLLLLADEPTGNVDEEMAAKLLYLFLELNKMGTTVVIATHSQRLINQFDFPQIYLEKGQMTIKETRKTKVEMAQKLFRKDW